MPRTLLLADDSVVIQKLVGLSFANEDVELITADNGDDAIARAREARPDAVIADVIMPGKSGYEVCEAIKQDPQLAHVPVLLLTGTFEAFDEERAAAVGSAGHITKPFEAQALVERVKTLFAAAPPVAASAAAAAPSGSKDPLDVDEAFDFFDDDVSDLSKVAESTPSARPTTTADTDPLADPFFGDGDASIGGLPPADDLDAGLLGSDSTVALMPDDDEADDASDFSTDLVNLGEPAPPAATPSGATTTLLDDALDGDAFAFEDEPVRGAAAWTATDSPAETVIADFGDAGDPFQDADDDAGPESMSALDVSDQLEIGTASPAQPVDAARTLLADELFTTSPRGAAVDLDAALAADDALASVPIADVELDPGSSAYDLSSSDLGVLDVAGASFAGDVEPLDDDAFEAQPIEEEPLVAAAAPAASAMPQFAPELEPEAVAIVDEPEDDAAPATARAAVDLTPALRERLHETLEKVAWEAFSELSEQVVKQVLERVEAIAWEVIPQMTEALIRDEIRRMKGEDESAD